MKHWLSRNATGQFSLCFLQIIALIWGADLDESNPVKAMFAGKKTDTMRVGLFLLVAALKPKQLPPLEINTLQVSDALQLIQLER